MKLIIVRHAETDDNVGGGLADRTSEVLLNENGVAQAEKLGQHLKSHNITHAYASPQKRAVHTAEVVLKHYPSIALETVGHLKEQNLGIYESVPKEVWKEVKKNAKEPFHLFKPEKGESYADLQQRAKAFLHELVKKHTNDTVLIVSHGGTLGVLLLDILEKELTEENYKAHQPKNTEFTVVEITEDGKKVIEVLNSRVHLDEKV
jgi:broad specificity phosphatase PhoE